MLKNLNFFHNFSLHPFTLVLVLDTLSLFPTILVDCQSDTRPPFGVIFWWFAAIPQPQKKHKNFARNKKLKSSSVNLCKYYLVSIYFLDSWQTLDHVLSLLLIYLGLVCYKQRNFNHKLLIWFPRYGGIKIWYFL